MSSRPAFTLTEVMLAVGLTTVVVLTLLGLGLALLQGNRKTVDLAAAQLIGEGELQKAIYQAENDSADPLWTQNSATVALRAYTVNEYRVALYAVDVRDLGGTPLRGKKVGVLVDWWDSRRAGYGRMQVRNSRLLHGP